MNWVVRKETRGSNVGTLREGEELSAWSWSSDRDRLPTVSLSGSCLRVVVGGLQVRKLPLVVS